MLMTKFPEHPELQDRMIGLAREELAHFHQVFQILRRRGESLGQDHAESYVKLLMSVVRHPKDQHLLDRLLVAAVIEARSCERFCLFAEALPAGDLKDFYVQFAMEESAHFPLFVDVAKLIYPAPEVDARLKEILHHEGTIIPNLPIGPTVH